MSDDRLRPHARPTTPKTLRHAPRKTPKRAFGALLVGAFVATMCGALVNAAGPASAKPDLQTVQQKVDRLFHQAEVASERYNSAHTQLSASRTTLAALRSDLGRQSSVVDRMRKQVAAMVVSQYQGQDLSTAGQVALSNDPSVFLDNLNAVSAYNSQRGEVMGQYSTELSRLDLRQRAVSQESNALAGIEHKLAADKAEIDKAAAAAKSQLDQLKAKQRAEIVGGAYSGPTPTVSTVPASGRAGAAVRYAMAQVGKAYVYGAAGPSAFDCSGLTMAAWGAAGVGLPHNAAAQMGMGTPVSESQLRPGDLVFYYSPVSHVGMYIGNGLIVNAENPSAGVRVTGLHTMPYSGAVRP